MRLKYVKHLSSTHPVLPMIIADSNTVFGSSYEGEKGMPTMEVVGESDHEILPLGWLIDRHCFMKPDFSAIVTPNGKHLQTVFVDRLPYLTKENVRALIASLPQREVPGRSGEQGNLYVNVACRLRLRCAAVSRHTQWTAMVDVQDQSRPVEEGSRNVCTLRTPERVKPPMLTQDLFRQ